MKQHPTNLIDSNKRSTIRSAVARATILAALLAMATTGSQAQSYRGGKSGLHSGGGTSRGGDYEIKGSIGIVDRRPTLQSQEYALAGGVVALVTAVQTPDAPVLHLSLSATNTVLLSWEATITDFVLEQSSDANGSAWTSVETATVTVGANQNVSLPLTAGNKFFRLRKP
jgi:hypothetical protein